VYESVRFPDVNPQTEFKYWAFISYSREANRKDRIVWAGWLHDAVEIFKAPRAATNGNK